MSLSTIHISDAHCMTIRIIMSQMALSIAYYKLWLRASKKQTALYFNYNAVS